MLFLNIHIHIYNLQLHVRWHGVTCHTFYSFFLQRTLVFPEIWHSLCSAKRQSSARCVILFSLLSASFLLPPLPFVLPLPLPLSPYSSFLFLRSLPTSSFLLSSNSLPFSSSLLISASSLSLRFLAILCCPWSDSNKRRVRLQSRYLVTGDHMLRNGAHGATPVVCQFTYLCFCFCFFLFVSYFFCWPCGTTVCSVLVLGSLSLCVFSSWSLTNRLLPSKTPKSGPKTSQTLWLYVSTKSRASDQLHNSCKRYHHSHDFFYCVDGWHMSRFNSHHVMICCCVEISCTFTFSL